MDPNARNFKDFLQLYNQMTERCFHKCLENTNSPKLDDSEISCVEKCALKFIKFNNRLMLNFVKAQTDIANRRVKEAEEEFNKNNQANIQQEVRVSN